MERTVLLTMSVEELREIITDCFNEWMKDAKRHLPTSDLILFTTEDLEKIFKVTKRTLQAWRDKGLIGYVKVGGCIYFQQEEIERFLAENKREPFN